MWKIIILMSLFLNLAFAKTRFNDADSQKFLAGSKEAVAKIAKEHKDKGKIKINLQTLNPDVVAFLKSFVDEKKITAEEMDRIKKSYEKLTQESKDEISEEGLNKFIKEQFDGINQSTSGRQKEGKVCNKIGCEEGLQCAVSPSQTDGPACKGQNRECRDDKDCCSSTCSLNKLTKKKSCESTFACFRPVALGQSCLNSPVCSAGTCLEYNSKTLGIGECSNIGDSCKKNSECCSNSCASNRCEQSFICKDCTSIGKKLEPGKKCCEGLYPNEKHLCVPDLPPVVLPEVRIKTINKIFVTISDFFISKTEAQTTAPTAPAGQAGAASVATEVELKIMRSSSYKTCDIHFKDDFYSYLKQNHLLQLELALLSFDYVMLGDGVDDYWTVNSAATSSINNRLKQVATLHQEKRHAMNDKFEAIDLKLKCMCLDVKGYKNITEAGTKKLFETKCSEYSKYVDNQSGFDELEGDSSGIKAKRLLVYWTKTLQSFNANLAIDNSDVYTKLADVRDWVKFNVSKWGEGERVEDKIYSYTIRKPYWLAILFAAVNMGWMLFFGDGNSGAMIAAIAATVMTGYSSIWVQASLKGAWQDHSPYIRDIKTNSDDCGPWYFPWAYKCEYHDVYLNHPKNNICHINTYANACLKNFMAVYPNPTNQEGTPKYIIDPWVPFGVNKSLLIKDIDSGTAVKNYAESLNDAYENGKRFTTDGRTDPVLSTNYLAQFGLRFVAPQKFILTRETIAEIKSKAKDFAVSEKFFESTDEENLVAFANYAYEFHFLKPKLSRDEEISYPLPGLVPYLEYISNDVLGTSGVGAARAANAFGRLQEKYLEDYLRTLELYANDNPINQSDPTKKIALDKEIESTRAELKSIQAFNALAANPNLDGKAYAGASGKLSGTGNVTGEGGAFLNAIGKMRSDRKAQLTQLAAYNKAIAGSGDPERASRVAAASKAYSASLAAPMGGSRGASAFDSAVHQVSSAGGDHSGDSKSTKGFDRKMLNIGAGTIAPGMPNYGSSSSKKSTGAADAAVTPKQEDEDTRRISDAIEARNKTNKSKYESNDELTIFEKVTNAYIRNYDKILTKRKDKEEVLDPK